MEKTVCFQRVLTLAFQRIGEEVLILVPKSRQVHLLNETGTFLWVFLERPHSLEECVQHICQEYEVSVEEAKRCVLDFLNHLLERNMIVQCEMV